MKLSKTVVISVVAYMIAGIGGYITGVSKQSINFMPEPLDEGHHMACCMADGWRDFALARLLDDASTGKLSDEQILLRYRINLFFDLLYHYAVNEKYDVSTSMKMLDILEKETGLSKEQLLDYGDGHDFLAGNEQESSLRLRMSQGYFSRLWLWDNKNYELAKDIIINALKNESNRGRVFIMHRKHPSAHGEVDIEQSPRENPQGLDEHETRAPKG